MGILALMDFRKRACEQEYMPLLRSLAHRAAPVAINMAMLARIFHSRSADFQSAVSQNFIPQAGRHSSRRRNFRQSADCKSAIQQIENLRYAVSMPLSRLSCDIFEPAELGLNSSQI